MDKKELVKAIYDAGAILFQNHILTSGKEFPLYINLRLLVSQPIVLKAIADAVWENLPNTDADYICGIPYGALPIASYLSVHHQHPMLLLRKSQKTYADEKLIDGNTLKAATCILIDDFITTGGTMLHQMNVLRQFNINVQAVSTFIDSEKGGSEQLKEMGIPVFSTFTLKEFFSTLKEVVNLTDNQLSRIDQACGVIMVG